MRFIGNKENLIDKIYQIISSKDIHGETFCDLFAGTASVGKYFKKLGYKIISSDLMYFSYVLQRAYIVNSKKLEFKKLLKTLNLHNDLLFTTPLIQIVEYLNQLPPVQCFIYHNYTPKGTVDLPQPRMFFTEENGKSIDAIRQKIEEWKNDNLLTENEYFVLLACLIESVPFYANIAGVYAAFHKKWDPRALKKMVLRPIETILSDKENISYNRNSVELSDKIQVDIMYLDPPYNHRQYAPNYHLLETIAKYDNPEIKGVAGLRDYENQKSKFCNAKTALEELILVAKKAKYKYLILSYNSEGVMPKEEIISALKQFGTVELIEFDYLRFKSNSGGESRIKKFIQEQLYILKRNEKESLASNGRKA